MSWRLLPLLGIAGIFGCSSAQSPISQDKEDAHLPEIVKCIEIPKVFDTVPPVSRLNGRRLFSYAHTYNSISFSGDSVAREQIRLKNASIARNVVQKVFPGIELVNDREFQNMTYKEIFSDHARIYHLLTFLTSGSLELINRATGDYSYGPPDDKTMREAEMSIENLTVDSDSQLQLFMHIRTRINREVFSNKVYIYVFNTKTRRIPYYDELEYYCDIRDHEALVRVLRYALEKI